MRVELTKEAVKIIENIINSGNKAVIQRNRDTVLVMEESRKIKYGNTNPSRD